ncbi:UNVERIFIED_CONTAM: hypothetical protein GTU68_023544, partial [Idotea baltica]|nr:hypothetical protein [Idotea baltica]
MTHIISFANHKGGVGKTTSTHSIGVALGKAGKRVLLVDFDPQGNMSDSAGVHEPEHDVYEALTNKIDHLPIVKLYDNVDILPASIDLASAEQELSSEMGREYFLKTLLDAHKDEYDFILIDCPPSLGLLTTNALTASTDVFIPIQAQYLAMKGLDKLLKVVDIIKKRLNPTLKVSGVLITQYNSHISLNKNVYEFVQEKFPDTAFKTAIRSNI